MPDRCLVGALHPVVLHHVVNSLGWSRLRPLQQAAAAPVAARLADLPGAQATLREAVCFLG